MINTKRKAFKHTSDGRSFDRAKTDSFLKHRKTKHASVLGPASQNSVNPVPISPSEKE
jgi:hypothetical protein